MLFGKLMPKEEHPRYRVIEWLMWQMGGIGPMLGQVHHFVKYNKDKAPYAEERYLKEAHRLYGVLDRRLADREYVAARGCRPLSSVVSRQKNGRCFATTEYRNSLVTAAPGR